MQLEFTLLMLSLDCRHSHMTVFLGGIIIHNVNHDLQSVFALILYGSGLRLLSFCTVCSLIVFTNQSHLHHMQNLYGRY